MALFFDVEAYLSQSEEDARIPRPSLEELVDQLERTKRIKSRALISSLLTYVSVTPEVQAVMSRWQTCEKWRSRIINGFDQPFLKRCNHPLCPACSPRLAWKEGRRIRRRLDEASGFALSHDYLSWVTINIAWLPVGADFGVRAEMFRKKLRNLRHRRLKGSLWAMEFEIAVEPNASGKLHVHGLVFHPGIAREHLLDELRTAFGMDRKVSAQALRSSRVVKEIEGAGEYQADVDLRLNGWGSRTAHILADLIHSYETIRTRGRMGLRFEIGIRAALKKRCAEERTSQSGRADLSRDALKRCLNNSSAKRGTATMAPSEG